MWLLWTTLAMAERPPACSAPGQTQYVIEAHVDSADVVATVDETVTVTNRSGTPWDEVVFRLPEKLDQIKSLTAWSGDVELPLEGQGATARVTLPVPAGAAVTLRLHLELHLPFESWEAAELLDFGVVGHMVLLGDWLPLVVPHRDGEFQVRPAAPVGDHGFFEPADFSVSLTTRAKSKAVATGERVGKSRRSGGFATHTFEAKGVRQFAAAVCSGCQTHEVVGEGFALNITAFGAVDTAVPFAKRAMAWMTDRVGPLSATELDIVMVPAQGDWGVEFPGFVFMSDPPQRPSFGYTFVLGHEIAHQWWYSEVGNDQWTHPWIDEGLATWMSASWMTWDDPEHANSFGVLRDAAAEQVLLAPTHNVLAYDRSSYNANVYERPALFWERLRRVDPKAFERAIRRYYLENRCGFAVDTTLFDLVVEEQTRAKADLPSLYHSFANPVAVGAPRGEGSDGAPVAAP